MRFENVLDAIGRTPLIRIHNFLDPTSLVKIFAKIEWLNPGGSVKDRTALGLISQGEKDGTLKEGSVIVESTSGNLGVALAMICAIKKYRFICVIDPKTPQNNVALLRAYGAEVEIVCEPDVSGGYQKPRIEKVKELVNSIPNAVNLDQYNNPASRRVHYNTTAKEIFDDLDGKVDVLVGAISTGGHLCGTAEYLKEKKPNIVIIGVEPYGSVIFGGKFHPYKQSGTGLSFKPGNYIEDLIDVKMKVSDDDAFACAKELAKKEGLLVGGSSGGVFHVALRYAKTLKRVANVVAIFPDNGGKYL